MAEHFVVAGAKTCQWGFFDAASAPVAHVKSGDTVTIDTVSGNPNFMPPTDTYTIPPALLDIHRNVQQGPGPHVLTGPVHIEGAEPGDVLQVEIEDVRVTTDWGLNRFRPLSGTLPYDFDEAYGSVIHLDRDRMVGRLPWGLELPLAPFFGIMSVAPPAAWGQVTSIMPRAFGGNIDNKELVAGTTLYLPVFVEGALFTCGDGHGCQGDGEVNVNAIETALEGRFKFIVRKDLRFEFPRAETKTHFITMGMDPDLDNCAVMALRDMIVLLGEKGGLSRQDAYVLCSLAGDLRVTQTVNGCKGIHMMMEKKLFGDHALRM